MSNLLLKIINRIKKEHFVKEFKKFELSSSADKSCSFIGKENIEIGGECSFGQDCEFIAFNSHLGQKLESNLKFGNHVRITSRCRITCAGNIEIGNDVLIAPDVLITDHNHGMDPTYSGGYSEQHLEVGKIFIDDGVWIGRGVCVLPNVSIGAHSIVGAGSIVTHNIPEYTMVAGNPARIIKRYNKLTQKWENI